MEFQASLSDMVLSQKERGKGREVGRKERRKEREREKKVGPVICLWVKVLHSLMT